MYRYYYKDETRTIHVIRYNSLSVCVDVDWVDYPGSRIIAQNLGLRLRCRNI